MKIMCVMLDNSHTLHLAQRLDAADAHGAGARAQAHPEGGVGARWDVMRLILPEIYPGKSFLEKAFARY